MTYSNAINQLRNWGKDSTTIKASEVRRIMTPAQQKKAVATGILIPVGYTHADASTGWAWETADGFKVQD